jgi:hypothetical protein
MPSQRKWKRFFIRTFIILAAILILITIVASPITRYFLQKYDVKFTGREIKVGRVLVNPLAGSVSLHNFRIYEPGSDTVFVYARKFSANISILKLISGVYDISSIRLSQPEIRIVKTDSVFNFNDILQKFATGKDTLKNILKLNIRNIKISDCIVLYSERNILADLTFSDINFTSSGFFWDRDTITGKFSLVPGVGDFSGNFTLNKDSLDYKVDMNLSGLGLNQFEPYFDAMAGKASLSGYLNLNLSAYGNFHQLMKGHASGNLELKNVHLGPDPGRDYLSLKRLLVQFRDIDVGKSQYYFDSILVDRPYILYQKYDTLDNFRRLFSTWFAKRAAEKVKEVADTVSLLVNLIGVDYDLRNFDLKDARIDFNDYSIAEKFSISLDPLNIKSDSINKSRKRVRIAVNSKIKPFGRFDATLSMNPENDKYFDFKYEFRDIAASMFNPYIASFTSYQLDHGTIEMRGDWSIRNAAINAKNHFLALNPQDTKKVRGKDTKWIPLPLIMAFVRERGSVIDYQIPVKGNLKDPAFKPGDIITDILRNILVKPPTTPYRLEVKNVEKEIEKTLRVKWQMRQYAIEEGQDKFMKHVSTFLKDNPEARIVVQPVFYEEKEKENLLLFEAKKKFFLEKHKDMTSLSKKDSMEVEKLTFKDHALRKFLDGSLKKPELLTLQEKCYRVVGKEIVERDYKALVEKRREAFLKYFKDNKSDERVEILNVKNEVPYNWFSYYDINYKGEVPESLAKAFRKLYEINSEPPRREYFKP